jgi:hypothetical protein
MTTGRPIPATPDQIVRFGHIAAAMRKAMDAKRWTIGDLNQACGQQRGNTGVYAFLNSKAAPGAKVRARLSKVLGLPESALLARDGSRPVEAGPALQIEGPRATPQRAPAPPVLQFLVDGDGMARIKLDVSLATDKAVPLLRLLLDAGMIVGGAS